MPQTAPSTLYKIYSDIVTAVSSVINSKYIFLRERPKFESGTIPMSQFVVISLPLDMEDYIIGNRKIYLTTGGILYLFNQSKSNGTLNLNATGTFIDSIVDLFPINGTYVSAVKPVVQQTGSDENGFQVTTVTFDLRSKWGALSNQT